MARGRKHRGPASREVLKSVRGQLARGWPAGLTVLTGDDLYHLDAAQRELIRGLAREQASAFGLTVFGEERVPVSTVVSASRSLGMFSDRRVVLVREIGALEGDPQALLDYAAEPPGNSFLLVRAPSLDRRRKLHQALASAGKLLIFSAPSAEDTGRLSGEVQRLAGELELNLSADAAMLLAQACAGDLYRVSAELEKLRAWLGEAAPRRVTAEIVREVASGGGLLTGWEVADAVLVREAGRALSAARRIVDAGDEPIRILGGLAWRARTLLQAKAVQEAGRPRHEVVREARAWAYEETLFRGLKLYSMKELLGFPALLLAADRALKSRALDPRAVLEDLVAKMIQAEEHRA